MMQAPCVTCEQPADPVCRCEQICHSQVCKYLVPMWHHFRTLLHALCLFELEERLAIRTAGAGLRAGCSRGSGARAQAAVCCGHRLAHKPSKMQFSSSHVTSNRRL